MYEKNNIECDVQTTNSSYRDSNTYRTMYLMNHNALDYATQLNNESIIIQKKDFLRTIQSYIMINETVDNIHVYSKTIIYTYFYFS